MEIRIIITNIDHSKVTIFKQHYSISNSISLFILFFAALKLLVVFWLIHEYAIPGNIHTPATEGIGIFWGGEVGGSVRPKKFKEKYEA